MKTQEEIEELRAYCEAQRVSWLSSARGAENDKAYHDYCLDSANEYKRWRDALDWVLGRGEQIQ